MRFDNGCSNTCKVLKSYEGMERAIRMVLKQSIKKSPMRMLGAWLMRKAFVDLKQTLDYTSIGGAMFAGVRAPVIKAHGNSNADAF